MPAPHRSAARFAALAFALLAGVGFARPARAQFGPDLRLTGPAGVVSQMAPGSAWSVASDDQDNLHVVYFDARGGAGDVAPYYRRYDRASASWEPEVRLPSFANAGCRYVAVAVDPLSQVHVLWVHTVPGDNHYVYYKKRDASGVWSSDLLLFRQAEWAFDVRDVSLSTDKDGNVYAFWAQGQLNGLGQPVYNVFYAFKDGATGAWGYGGQLTNYDYQTDPAPGARAPSPAAHFRWLGSGSIVHVAWADFNAGGVRFRDLRWKSGTYGPIGATQTLGVPAAPPTVAARCGEVSVAWSDPGTQLVQYRHGAMTYTLAETTLFDPPAPTALTGQSPNLAVDGLCNLHLVLLNGGAVKESQRSWVSGAWSAPVGVSDPGAVPSDPSIATDTHGSVHVVWSDSRASPPGSEGAYYDRGACVATPAPALAGGPSSGAADAARSGAAADGAAQRPSLTPDLVAARRSLPSSEMLPILVQMRAQEDLSSLRRRVSGLAAGERRLRVIGALRAAAGRAEAGVLSELIAALANGTATHVRPLWLVNAVSARVSPVELDRLAARSDIAAIAFDPRRPMLDAVPSARRADDGPRASGGPGRRARPPSGAAATTATPAWSVDWIHAPDVWSQGYQGACVLVADIDTGVDYTHPDLANRIWTNAGEIPGNGIDDDGNGYVDDVHGFDFDSNDGDPMDQNGHGTHTAGTVAGDGTGGTITGVAPQARIMAVQVLGPNGSGSLGAILDGIQYAVDNGAQVLTLSLGELCPDPPSRDLYRSSADAVAAAGVTMCVAAGNDRGKVRAPNMTRSPGDVPPPWISPMQPAIGATGGVTTVGATGHLSDALASFSSPGPVDWSQPSGSGDWRLCDPGTPNVGLIKPDVSAPGLDVLSCALGSGYRLDSGTSMATPHVAGLAALILSKNDELTSDQVEQILETTALDLGSPGKDNDFGAGRIRAPEAIAATPAPAGTPMSVVSHTNLDNVPPSDGDHRLEQGETADLKVTLANNSPYKMGDVVGVLTDDSPWVTITQATSNFGDIPPGQTGDNASNLYRVVVDPAAPPYHVVHFTVQVTAYGACGSVVFPDTVYDQVAAVEPPAMDAPLALSPVTPDPAGSSATIGFAIRSDGPVRLALYDVRGRRVRTLVEGIQTAGPHRLTWDGLDERGLPAAAGVYLVRLEAAGTSAQRKFAWLGR